MPEFLHTFACFNCSVAFKRPATNDTSTGSAHLPESQVMHLCPNCKHRMAFMGRNFAPPPKNNKSAWFAAKRLWEVGFRFVGSGYHTDPPLPKTKTEVETFILNNTEHCQRVGANQLWEDYA